LPFPFVVPGFQVGSANTSLVSRAQGNPYDNFQHMPAIGSELALMLLNQSGQSLGNPLNCHQSSFSSIIQNVKHSCIPPSTFGASIGSIKQEARPSNETQQQLSTPDIQRGDHENYEDQPGIDSISGQEINVAREPRNAYSYSSQSISGQNSKGEPKSKNRRSKKGSSRKTISDKAELSSVPSHIRDDQLHGSEAKVEGEQVNSRNNEDSSGTLTRGNFGEDLQVQPVEQHEISAPKFESSKSPDGGKSVSSVPNQGCFSQFFEGLDWMTQSSYYQDSNVMQSVSASENIFNPPADMPSTINGDTMEAFQNSCLSDCFPSSIQEFISSPELNSLTFLFPEMQNLDVQHDGSNLPSTSNSYVQMSFSEESGNQSASLSGLHMDAIHITTNNSSSSQPLTAGSFDAVGFSKLPNIKESQALPLQEIPNSFMGTPSCSMDAAEYSIDRSMKPMKPPVRTYTKV
jgi:auxin response factor